MIGGTGEIAACGSSTYSVITVVDTLLDNSVPHDERQVEMKTNTSIFMAPPGSTGDLIRKGTVADTIQDESSSGYWNVVVLLSLILVLMIAVFL